MQISPLDPKIHNRNKFDCGVPALNNYLKQTAGQHDNKSLSRTFVLIDPNDSREIIGFYSLAITSVSLEELPREISKKYPTKLFCTLIGRLAVSEKHQCNGYGELLLFDAVTKAVESSKMVAQPMIIVHAKNEIAKKFYQKFGFKSFPNMEDRLYLSYKNAKKIIDETFSSLN